MYREIRYSISPILKIIISRDALIRQARGSSAIANRSGDSGQPCQVPLWSSKRKVDRPFVS